MPQPAKRGVRTLLRKVAYEDVSLSDVLDDLRERTGSNIVVNWQSLENIGIDKTSTVNLDLMNVRAERVLKSVLDNFSTGWGYGRVSYVVHGGVVTIASSEDLGKIVDTWVLDITHLMRATKDKRGGSLFESVGGGPGDRGRGRTGTSTRRGSEADTAEGRDELKERMIELVRAAAPAESWREGGGPGAVSIYGTRLIVTQSITNLQKIAQTLAMLGW